MQITKIWDNLYLGSYLDAQNISLLKKNKITHIVTVAAELKPMFPQNFTYLHIQAHDNKLYQLIKYFDSIAEFIDNAIQNKGIVFVHCKWGISRSPTSIMAYLIKYHKMNVLVARNLIKSRREFISPNPGFMEQLIRYAKLNAVENGNLKLQITPINDMNRKQTSHTKIDGINESPSQVIQKYVRSYQNIHRSNTPVPRRITDLIPSFNDSKTQIQAISLANILKGSKEIERPKEKIERPKERINVDDTSKIFKGSLFSAFDRVPPNRLPTITQQQQLSPPISIIPKSQLPFPSPFSQEKLKNAHNNQSLHQYKISILTPIKIKK